MKINERYDKITFADETWLIPVGDEIAEFDGIIVLNEEAACLVNMMKGGDWTAEELAEKITRDYDVDISTAKQDIDSFLRLMDDYGVLAGERR